MASGSSWPIKLRPVNFPFWIFCMRSLTPYHTTTSSEYISSIYNYYIKSLPMITSYGSFCYSGSTWNFNYIILLLDNPVKLDSSLDSLFDKNFPFGVEKKVSRCLWIFPKREDSAQTQLQLTSISNNTVFEFFSTLVLWCIFNKLTGFILQLSNVITEGVFGS